MPKRGELKTLQQGEHGVSAAYNHALVAKKCGLLSKRVRVPKERDWSARVGKQFRDGVMVELKAQRENEHLSALDWACLDSVYFAACGLAMGYEYLGVKGWIDEAKADFHPIVSTCTKLQRLIMENFRVLGLERKPHTLDVFAMLYAGPEAAQDRSGSTNATKDEPIVIEADEGRQNENAEQSEGTQ